MREHGGSVRRRGAISKRGVSPGGGGGIANGRGAAGWRECVRWLCRRTLCERGVGHGLYQRRTVGHRLERAVHSGSAATLAVPWKHSASTCSQVDRPNPCRLVTNLVTMATPIGTAVQPFLAILCRTTMNEDAAPNQA